MIPPTRTFSRLGGVLESLSRRCANPARAIRRNNHQPIAEILLRPIQQKWQQNFGDVFRGGRMRFDPDDPKVFGQRQHHPVAKMFVEGDKDSFFPRGALKNQGIIRPRLAGFSGTNNIMPGGAQRLRQFRAEHLVEIKAHSGSSRADGGNLRVQNGTAGVIQDRLNVRARQFRVAPQNGVPRFIFRQLLQNGRHGNARAFDNRLAAANPRVDFDSLAHAANLTRGQWKPQAPGDGRQSQRPQRMHRWPATNASFSNSRSGGENS
jgi:hypothetical protein